jgi:hypothetical protein
VLRLGLADHFGWAVAVVVADDRNVVTRRRIELVEPGVTPAPIHYESKHLDDAETAALIAEVRASVVRAASAALDELADGLAEPIVSMSVRAWPPGFPTDVAVQRRAPHEARADGVMYRTILADLGRERAWAVHLYDAKAVIGQASRMLGETADQALAGPRDGGPWNKDHRVAFAAAIVAG